MTTRIDKAMQRLASARRTVRDAGRELAQEARFNDRQAERLSAELARVRGEHDRTRDLLESAMQEVRELTRERDDARAERDGERASACQYADDARRLSDELTARAEALAAAREAMTDAALVLEDSQDWQEALRILNAVLIGEHDAAGDALASERVSARNMRDVAREQLAAIDELCQQGLNSPEAKHWEAALRDILDTVRRDAS